ncbi:uncharacterized protein LOC105696001 [Orussus abietinus]|uniref:uncharacterized protein LOC105696001 n=1 Tax=Orussus abietinus TaxID=222816 RepID=UPI000625C18F|nr:uncharacterized protein LOC105696001 [Orussus abietinus]
MSTEHSSGKGYTRLPQSISNTDSENEDEHPYRLTSKPLGNQSVLQDSPSAQQNGQFCPIDKQTNLTNRSRNGCGILDPSKDNVPIITIEKHGYSSSWNHRTVSPFRFFCLILSILVCVCTILVFLYFLPCDSSLNCQTDEESSAFVPWNKSLQGIEIHGRISMVKGPSDNLIFLLHGQRYGDNLDSVTGQQQIPPQGGGVLSIRGSNGIPLWWVSLKRLPVDINCTILDVDGSGKPDCLVAGEKGLLIAIEPTAGTVHWSSTLNTYSELPVLLSDANSDGIDDLLSVESSEEFNSNLLLVSGKNGELLSRYKFSEDCKVTRIYGLEVSSDISYLCSDRNGKLISGVKRLSEILGSSNILNAKQRLFSPPKTAPKVFPVLEHDFKNYTRNLTLYTTLHIQNQGTCPGKSCLTTVNIKQGKLGNETSIWSYACQNTFTVEPAMYNLFPAEPNVTGFVLKFWRWTGEERRIRNVETDTFEQKVTEVIVTVLVNRTVVRVVNIGENEITQLCRRDDCQPSLKLHTHSMAVMDIDNNGLQDLISYRSSYKVEKPQVLESTIEIVRLDDGVFDSSKPLNCAAV